MSFTIAQIQQALINSLSMNREERDNSARFLTKECEPNPAFQLALIHIIEKPEGNMQLQYQAILCMKNSLTRLLSQHRSRQRRVVSSGPVPSGVKQVGFTGFVQPKQQSNQSELSEEMRSQIKEHLLLLVEDSNNVILTENSYEQLTLVVAIFIKYDFPGSWPQFGQWLLKAFDQLHQSLPTLQLTDAPKIKRFLTFCFEVMAEQNRKKLNSSKAQFQKVAKDYLKAVAKVWSFFQQQQEQMILQNDQLTLSAFNDTIFDIASKLDKVLILVVSCGFNLTSLPNEPDSNVYVETTAQLIKKFKFFVTVASMIRTQLPESDQKSKYYNLMVGQVKTYLKHLSELQGNDPLLMFNQLDQYLQTICVVLGQSEFYPIRVNKLAMIALFKIINTSIYNQNVQQDLEPQSNGIDILFSPVKFKNLQPMIEHANLLYMKVLNMPTPKNPDHQDGARKLLELVTHKFLSQVDLDSWQRDPEYFIENEDEQFLLEYDLQADCSLNLLAQHLIEKLLQKFYSICYPFVKEIMQQYFTCALQPNLSERVEDALLNLVGIVGKVQREYKVVAEKRLDVCYVLKFIRECKWENPIFKRRYLLIITHWAKILPKIYFYEIFQSVLQSLDAISPADAKSPLNQVFIYEHCHCIHELLKEINYWLQRQDEFRKSKDLPKDELRGPSQSLSDSKEDQIAMSKLIDSQINYSLVFQKLCFKIVPLLDCFKQPTLIWHMICFLTFILEKNCEQPESTIECLRSLNILKILQAQTQSHVDEAVIDMLKNLLCQCPASPVILEMCTVLLDYKLTRSMNDGNAIQFWLFTMRATSLENPSIALLQNLFIKFSGCLIHVQNSETVPTVNSVANTIIKRDYIYIEFLRVAQEAVLLGMFLSENGVQQMIQFTTFKFMQSIEQERTSKSRTHHQSSDSQDSDGDNNPDMTMYEKLTYLVMIPHTLFWLVQASQTDSAYTFECSRAMIANCCLYLIESKIELKAVKQIPSNSLFFTQLLTYINRIIVVKTQQFMVILQELINARGLQLYAFVQEWIKKMDMILSQEANRVNCLAIYSLLPFLPAQLVQHVLSDIARITFGMLQDNLYQKLINNQGRFHSPSRTSQVSSLIQNTNVVRMRTYEKMSQRLEELKRKDLLLDIDLIEHFWQQMRMLANNLQLQDISVLSHFINDPNLSQQFVNLINGVSPKYDQDLKEQQEQ